MDYSKLVLKTEWATDPETGLRYKARYGFDGDFALRYKQAPYLSVCHYLYEVSRTGRLRERLHDIGGGILSQEVADRLFPGPIAGLVPFHLCSVPGGPMHYLTNTVYLAGDRDHWGLLKGERSATGRRIGDGKPREFDLARQSAVWPEATDEELSAPPEELRRMLEARLPALLVRMRAACEAAGLLWPED